MMWWSLLILVALYLLGFAGIGIVMWLLPPHMDMELRVTIVILSAVGWSQVLWLCVGGRWR